MKTTKTLALALLAGTIATPAFAGNANDLFPKWYVGMRGAISSMKATDLGTSPLPDLENDFGFNGGATFGIIMPRSLIAPLNGLRFEVEASRYWQHIDNDRTDLVFPIMAQSSGEREFKATSYMVNAYYYIPLNTMFSPYVGGGFGKAQAELERDPVAPIIGNDEDDVNAWQAMAGFSFETDPDAITEWHLGYRYFKMDDAEFADGFGGTTVIENSIHSVEAGVNFRF